jgi:hypothetical protein
MGAGLVTKRAQSRAKAAVVRQTKFTSPSFTSPSEGGEVGA